MPTWCRLRHQNSNGPKPVRNKAFPWGLPWLKEHERSQVDAENDALRSTLRLLNQVHTSRPRVNWYLLQPEDLGTAKRGTTASPWQLRELRQWARNHGLQRNAPHHAFGKAPTRDSLGVLSSISLGARRKYKGWPSFAEESIYTGPLPTACSCPEGLHRNAYAARAAQHK